MSDVADHLRLVLEKQLGLYQEITTLQSDLLQRLDDTNQLASVMELLARKNTLLDAIRHEIHEAAPLVDAWVAQKEEMLRLPCYTEVESLLGDIEALIATLRAQDERMIRRFEGLARPATNAQDQQAHSRNMLNAFRALR